MEGGRGRGMGWVKVVWGGGEKGGGEGWGGRWAGSRGRERLQGFGEGEGGEGLE